MPGREGTDCFLSSCWPKKKKGNWALLGQREGSSEEKESTCPDIVKTQVKLAHVEGVSGCCKWGEFPCAWYTLAHWLKYSKPRRKLCPPPFNAGDLWAASASKPNLKPHIYYRGGLEFATTSMRLEISYSFWKLGNHSIKQSTWGEGGWTANQQRLPLTKERGAALLQKLILDFQGDR